MAFTVYAETPVNEEPIPVVTEETTYEEPAQIPAEAEEPSLLAADCTTIKTEYTNITQCQGGMCNAYNAQGVYATQIFHYFCSDGTSYTTSTPNVKVHCC